MRRMHLVLPPIVLLAALSYTALHLRRNTHEILPDPTLPPFPLLLHHDPAAEKYWNAHMRSVAQQGSKVQLVSDGSPWTCQRGPSGPTGILSVEEQFIVPDRHGRFIYTVQEVQHEGVVLECYSDINLPHLGKKAPPQSRIWFKLFWRPS